MKKLNRRKFFNRLSIGAIGTLILSMFPSNLFGLSKTSVNSKIKVKIHPSSVKRNNKGS